MMVTSELSIELTMLNCIPLCTSSASVHRIATTTTASGTSTQRMLRNRTRITAANRPNDHQNSFRPSSSTYRNMS